MPDKTRTTRVITGSLALAKRVENQLKVEAGEFKHTGKKKAPIIDEVWEKYIAWAKNEKKSWKDDQDKWNLHIKEHLGGKRIDAITKKDVLSILDKMLDKKTPHGKPYSPASRKHVLVMIKRLFNWATERELFYEVNPAKHIKPPKLNNEVTENLTEVQIKDLLRVAWLWPNRRAGLIVIFALYTGFRLGEILSLKWSQVDKKNGFINLPDPKGHPVTMPISQECIELLDRTFTFLCRFSGYNQQIQ